MSRLISTGKKGFKRFQRHTVQTIKIKLIWFRGRKSWRGYRCEHWAWNHLGVPGWRGELGVTSDFIGISQTVEAVAPRIKDDHWQLASPVNNNLCDCPKKPIRSLYPVQSSSYLEGLLGCLISSTTPANSMGSEIGYLPFASGEVRSIWRPFSLQVISFPLLKMYPIRPILVNTVLVWCIGYIAAPVYDRIG